MMFLPCAVFFMIVRLGAGASVPAGHAYLAPGPNDVRSPCPGLNSAANHGFIPRNGKNISPQVVAAGLKKGLNVGLDFGLLVGVAATASNANPLAGTFNLDDLQKHNFPIEHDVSLSRQDIYQGENLRFNQSVFNEVLAFYDGMERTSLPAAARSVGSRIRTQRRINGDREIYSARQLVLSLGETSLYMSVMGNPLTGNAPIAYVRSFFEQERLPYELGWQAPTLETNFPTLGVMAGELILASPGDFATQFPDFGVDALKDVFQLRDPVTGVVINATCALVGLC